MARLSQKGTENQLCFTSENFRLAGRLHLPERSRPPVVIGSHGLFADSESPKQIALANACVSVGLGFFRFDHRGCGQSQGDFRDRISFDARCTDLLEACNMILKREDTGNEIALFGSSLGGAAVLSAAPTLSPRAAVTFAAPADSGCVHEALLQTPLPAQIPPDFRELLHFDITGNLSRVKNILIIHGEKDTVVPPSHARKIYSGAASPKKIVIQQNGDHRMSHEPHQKEFIRAATRWLNQGFERNSNAQ